MFRLLRYVHKSKVRKSIKLLHYVAVALSGSCIACGQVMHSNNQAADEATQLGSYKRASPLSAQPGIYTFMEDIEKYKNRKLAIVANHTSLIEEVHLVDTLLHAGVEVVRIFAPEHGFRGDVADGVVVKNQRDDKTGIEIVSLYGKNKKPFPEQLIGVDLIVFDIQDVGARFYTYLSTLHYIMEAAAEADIEVIVLDRPNPNIHYTDGPVLKSGFSSFVGMHPVPIVYGMSIGEYAQMVNGEGWLANAAQCRLVVIPCEHYSRSSLYKLPVAPSPNLPDMTSVYLYPALCLFEGTDVSVGRGTKRPFTVIGSPQQSSGDFYFTPQAIAGVSDHPPHEHKQCRGYNLQESIDLENPPKELDLSWLLRMYAEHTRKDAFFLKTGFFDKLAGTDALRLAVVNEEEASSIKERWQEELRAFSELRKPYLIYPE